MMSSILGVPFRSSLQWCILLAWSRDLFLLRDDCRIQLIDLRPHYRYAWPVLELLLHQTPIVWPLVLWHESNASKKQYRWHKSPLPPAFDLLEFPWYDPCG